ncbi:hypothetical protein NOS3756_59640 (plasmid) [Nostoc sp. NIES-3756]|uniref:hypothetical protein n=1 Tax=Nostoc sp. NIES-3756 TaxID=1751286 RepID=UPI00071FB719|nr:hypothetical protein [Nostoc sp. NIES-3756]BAT56952.1 hypothetical protein NOS3756_59640 [Nostoc sp. NIES-3756]
MTYTRHTQQAPTSFNRNPIDEQALAQAELYGHLEAQVQAVAPESLTIQEIHSQHFEIFAGKQLIAYITYDHSDYITQRWVVMVQGNEIFRHNTIARCLRYVEWHHKDASLPTPLPAPVEYPEVPTVAEISFYDQELIADGQLIASVEYDHDEYADLYWRVMVNDCEIYRDTTPARCNSYVKQAYQQGMLPVQRQEEPCTTGNEIMAHMGDEEELSNLQPVEVIQKDGEFLFVAFSLEPQPVADGSLGASGGDFLDVPFDQLTSDEWLRLMETEIPSRELLAA